MKVIEPGHVYRVEEGYLVFLAKNGSTLIHRGTTNEEIIEVLLDRLQYLNEKLDCTENRHTIYHLGCALEALNERTANRIKQGVEGTDKPHV